MSFGILCGGQQLTPREYHPQIIIPLSFHLFLFSFATFAFFAPLRWV
jgi:hypothetical protein